MDAKNRVLEALQVEVERLLQDYKTIAKVFGKGSGAAREAWGRYDEVDKVTRLAERVK